MATRRQQLGTESGTRTYGPRKRPAAAKAKSTARKTPGNRGGKARLEDGTRDDALMDGSDQEVRPSSSVEKEKVEKPRGKAKAKAKAKALAKGSPVVATPKTKAKAKARSTKSTTTKHADDKPKRKGKREDDKTQTGPSSKSPKLEHVKTFAGRWIPSPSDQQAHARFMAIKDVFDRSLARVVRAPSQHERAFFKVCVTAFKDLSARDGNELNYEDFAAAARDQADIYRNNISF